MKPRIRYFESIGVYRATLIHRGEKITGYGLTMRNAYYRALGFKHRLDHMHHLYIFGGK